MRLGLLTCCWRRPRLTAMVLDYYAALNVPGVQVTRMAVVSPEDDSGALEVVAESDWNSVYASNDELGRKWNRGLQALRAFQPGVDVVMIIGSDDLLTPAYFEHVRDLLADGVEFISLRNLHVYDVSTGRLAFLAPAKTGAGRIVGRRILEATDWRLWDDDQTAYMDGNMHRRCMQYKPKKREIVTGPHDEIAVVDIKGTGTNMWHLDGDQLRGPNGKWLRIGNVEDLEAGPWLRQRFPEQADALLDWQQTTELVHEAFHE